MIHQSHILAKATSPETRSDAIVVSFDSNWYSRLQSRAFTAVIRRRVPTRLKPSWLYFHVNHPKSAICARAALAGVDHLDLESALKISDALCLSREAITTYVGDTESIGVYWLQEIHLPKTEIRVTDLADRMLYNPPQSFFVLSKDAKGIIDNMCDFTARRSTRTGEKNA